MTTYAVESYDEVLLPYRREYVAFKLPLTGAGYLAGEFPDGVTSIDGVPAAATVRVLLRTTAGHPGDGALVAEVQSASDGSWRVDGLDPALKFDVVGRCAGFNDVIVANVSPEVD